LPFGDKKKGKKGDCKIVNKDEIKELFPLLFAPVSKVILPNSMSVSLKHLKFSKCNFSIIISYILLDISTNQQINKSAHHHIITSSHHHIITSSHHHIKQSVNHHIKQSFPHLRFRLFLLPPK
jgi:hypothetical protein